MPLDVGGPAKCPQCGRSFQNEHGLKVHLVRAHGIKPTDGRERLDRKRAKDRASYARRKAARDGQEAIVKVPGEARPAALVRQVNFCPHCGQNVHLVAQAMAIAEGFAGG